eukprot:6208131-Prymnesium_polylepis.1
MAMMPEPTMATDSGRKPRPLIESASKIRLPSNGIDPIRVANEPVHMSTLSAVTLIGSDPATGATSIVKRAPSSASLRETAASPCR